MATYDFSQVSAAYDKASYSAGETITITLNGVAVRIDDPNVETVSVTLQLSTESGGVGSISLGNATVNHPGTQTDEAVRVDGPVFTAAGRTWTVSADGKSATTIA